MADEQIQDLLAALGPGWTYSRESGIPTFDSEAMSIGVFSNLTLVTASIGQDAPSTDPAVVELECWDLPAAIAVVTLLQTVEAIAGGATCAPPEHLTGFCEAYGFTPGEARGLALDLLRAARTGEPNDA